MASISPAMALTLADSAGMHGEGDREFGEWALVNVRLVCDIFSGLDSPNWYGHAMYCKGILLHREGDHREAIGSLGEGRTSLGGCGGRQLLGGGQSEIGRMRSYARGS